MTNKSRNIAVISGTSFLCAVLVGVIAAQFTGGSKQQDYTAIETSPPEIVAKITTTTHYETTAPDKIYVNVIIVKGFIRFSNRRVVLLNFRKT